MTVVEGDPKVPFSIATTLRCRGGRYSIPWIGPYPIILSAKQGDIKYHFLTRPGIELPVSRAIGKHSTHKTNGFNPRSRHAKDFKNGAWYLLV